MSSQHDDNINYYEVSRSREKARRFLTPAFICAEVLITIGVIVALFIVYQVFITDIVSQKQQTQAVGNLRDQWNNLPADQKRQHASKVVPGGALGILHAQDMSPQDYPVFKGVDQSTLAKGPGMYDDSAGFGLQGNVSIAAHRDGWNAPFSEIDKLHTCSTITLEDASYIYTYKVVSTSDNPSVRSHENADCLGQQTAQVLDSPDYSKIKGQSIVTPNMSRVVWSIPGVSRDANHAQLPLLTLTSCHPHWDNGQRIIVHAVNTATQPKE